MNKFQEMVRARLRARTPNYSTLAAFLKTDPSTIQKRLKEGGTALTLEWLDEASAFYQMTVSEMVTLANSVWQEVKPLEAHLLAHFRNMTELQRHSLLSVLDRPQSPEARRKPRGGHPELTEEQQLVVDLYARSEPQAREGVLKVLRGTAKQRRGKAAHSPSDDTNE